MKKKILPLVCILLLHSTLYAKSENDLPPLPISQSPITESQNTQSLWKRTLIFFGLDKQEKKDKPADLKLPDVEPEKETSASTAKTDAIITKDKPADLKLPDVEPEKETSASTAKTDAIITKDKPADLKLPDVEPEKETPASTAKTDPVITKDKPADLKLPDVQRSTEYNNKSQPNLSEKKSETKTSSEMLTEPQGLKNIDGLNVKNYRQNLKDRLNKPIQISKISKDDLINTNLKQDPAQFKFINDESQVLLLPNDEVVLGEVTRETQLNLMDLSSYIKIFWDNYYNIKDEPARQAIDNFVNNYDSNFNKQSYTPKQIESVIAEAFKAIDRNSIYDLMNLLDNYPILQLSDHQGNTLLHKSVYKNNYSAAKFLIMKGIDISVQNNQNLTALNIAISQKKANLENLLRAAGAKL